MKRLLGERLTGKSPSTGVAEKSVLVQVGANSDRVVPAAAEDSKWVRLTSCDDEAIEMMSKLALECNTQVPQEHQIDSQETTEEPARVFTSNSETISEDATHSSTGTVGELQHVSAVESENVTSVNNSFIKPQHKVELASIKHKSPFKLFKDAMRAKSLEDLRQYLSNHWSLYLTNTGGQMEFQELLPLLVSGPCMFFITFRLDRDLNKSYNIQFEIEAKESGSHHGIFKYASSAVPLETILQSLATIDAIGSHLQMERANENESECNASNVQHIYKVFIIGTHRDMLDKSTVKSRIREIDSTILEAVKSPSYFRNIQFATEHQLIFTVNNFSDDDSDFQHIRSSVQRLVDANDFRVAAPSRWLIYSLILHQHKRRVETYENCFSIAQDCGITSPKEHKEALHFVQTKLGVIRYFPVEGLNDFVILDPQLLFDRVTELIIHTFTFKQAGKRTMDDFKKGIFTFSDFERITDKGKQDPLLSPTRFLQLLEHLLITAPFKSDGELKYFLPCAISHVDKPGDETLSSPYSIPPLVVSFACGYCPMGIASALIAYLMRKVRNNIQCGWKLLIDEVYRNQVTFLIEQSCDRVVLKSYPTHLEITCLPDPDDSKRCLCSIRDTCIEIKNSLKMGIKKVCSSINYIHTAEYAFTFYCQAPACKQMSPSPHPAKLLSSKLLCPKRNRSCSLPNGHEIWAFQNPMKRICDCPHIPDNFLSSLYKQLCYHASRWRDIGIHLGFLQGELDNIEAAPNLFNRAPESWLEKMLAQWLEWAPGDHRKSTEYATLEALKKAVRDAGFGTTAEELHVVNDQPVMGRHMQLEVYLS